MKKLFTLMTIVAAAGCSSPKQASEQHVLEQTQDFQDSPIVVDAIDFTDWAECHILYTKECLDDVQEHQISDTDQVLLQQMTPLQRDQVLSVIEEDNMSKLDDPEYHELGGGYKLTIDLKNATAFGMPIKSIETGTGYEWEYRKITFVNADDLAKVSRHFSLADFKFDEPNAVLAVDHYKAYCDSDGENCEYKKTLAMPLYDNQGRQLPDLESVADGCYWGVVFNAHERTLSSQGGC